MRRKLSAVVFVLFFITVWVGCGPKPVETANNLTDIYGNWAYDQITYLLKQGDIAGYVDGTFKPDRAISRAEFITIINQAFNYTNVTSMSFRDVRPGDWYYREIARAKAAGYISGYPDGTMKPNNPISRQEAAAIIAKVMKINTSSPGALPFSDAASIPSWCRNAIAASFKAGLVHSYPDGSFRPFAVLTRAEAAALVVSGVAPNIVVPTGYNVKDYGARGDGIIDDTAAIQKAIDYAYSKGGGTVNVPAGTYLVNVETAIKLKSNIKLNLASNATLKAKTTTSGNYSIVLISDASNVSVIGGQMIGERANHTAAGGEWGMGIRMIGSSNIHVADISISDCWGDGIYVGSSWSGGKNYCENVVLERFKIDNCRRQGITVVSAKNLTIRNALITNTNGTNPKAGLDLEPNNNTEFMQNVLIENLQTINNDGYGILFAFGFHPNSPNPVTVTVRNHTDINSSLGALSDYRYFTSRPMYNCKIVIEN